MDADAPRDEERRPGGVRRAVDWLLLRGNRLVVAGLVVAVVLGVALAFEPTPDLTAQSAQPAFYALSALASGNLNLLTVVVSINQLVLTRELKSPRKFREEIDGIAALREDVAEATDQSFPPITPADFTRELLDAMDDEAATLRRVADDAADPDLREGLTDLADALQGDLAATRAALDERAKPTDHVVIALLAIDFASLYGRVIRLRADHQAALPEAGVTALERLATQLQQLDVTREHFKQLFTRESLSNMSRLLLYVGVPVEALLTYFLLSFVGLFDAAPAWGASTAVVYVVAALGLAPLAVVFAYVLRAATIARRTATTTQFTTVAERS